MRKFLSRLAWCLIAVAIVVAAGTLIPRPLWKSDEDPKTRRILVLSNPIHTDIAVPLTADVVDRFAVLKEDGLPIANPAAKWLVFGWGGRAFYLETPTWSDLRAGPVFKALTVDSSVLHVDVYGEVEPHPAVVGFEVGDAAFARLLAFIAESLTYADGRPLVIPGRGYGATDRFYEAGGSFNALIGCNTWTAQALREAGLTTGWWNPLPVLLTFSLDLYN